MAGSFPKILSIIQVSRIIFDLFSLPSLPRDLMWLKFLHMCLQLFDQNHRIQEIVFKISDHLAELLERNVWSSEKEGNTPAVSQISLCCLRSVDDRYCWQTTHRRRSFGSCPPLPRHSSKEPTNDQLHGVFFSKRNMVFL